MALRRCSTRARQPGGRSRSRSHLSCHRSEDERLGTPDHVQVGGRARVKHPSQAARGRAHHLRWEVAGRHALLQRAPHRVRLLAARQRHQRVARRVHDGQRERDGRRALRLDHRQHQPRLGQRLGLAGVQRPHVAVGAHAQQHQVHARHTPDHCDQAQLLGQLGQARLVAGRLLGRAAPVTMRRNHVGLGHAHLVEEQVARLLVRGALVGQRHHLVVHVRQVHLAPVDAPAVRQPAQHLEHAAARHGQREAAARRDGRRRRLLHRLAQLTRHTILSRVDGQREVGRI
mmetsp:Transcript_19960/g.50629  ORF Transcript_19960/g.50629 Transcript_19960/m.50629 type:complete len:287 (-) Transcript_19960:179-1039(-)